TRARAAEAGVEVEPHHPGTLFRERDRGSPGTAAGIEEPAAHLDSGRLEVLQDLRAAQVLEEAIVVLAAPAYGGRARDGAVVHLSHRGRRASSVRAMGLGVTSPG